MIWMLLQRMVLQKMFKFIHPLISLQQKFSLLDDQIESYLPVVLYWVMVTVSIWKACEWPSQFRQFPPSILVWCYYANPASQNTVYKCPELRTLQADQSYYIMGTLQYTTLCQESHLDVIHDHPSSSFILSITWESLYNF